MLQDLVGFLSLTRIHPVIDQELEFAEAPRAYERFVSGQHFGKIVIRVGG